MINSLRSSASIFLTSALLPFTALRAAEADPAPSPAAVARSAFADELVIANGAFLSRDGRSTPATLRNVVDAIIQRIPRANITIVGADEVPIQNLRVRLSNPAVDNVSLHGILTALREASGRRFEVIESSHLEFVLSAISGPESVQRVEVFNLNSLPGMRHNEGLKKDLDRNEAQMNVLTKRLPPDNPRVTEQAMAIDMLKAEIARAPKQTDASEKLIEQIQEIVRITLRQVHEGPQPVTQPKFKYHPGTGLLVVVGSEQALGVTRKVIAALY